MKHTCGGYSTSIWLTTMVEDLIKDLNNNLRFLVQNLGKLGKSKGDRFWVASSTTISERQKKRPFA